MGSKFPQPRPTGSHNQWEDVPLPPPPPPKKAAHINAPLIIRETKKEASPMSLSVFKPGTKVTIGNDITAQVRQVCIQEDGITYEVIWWSDRERKTQWLSAFEVEPLKETTLIPVGFQNGH
jgi:hypothetical protein